MLALVDKTAPEVVEMLPSEFTEFAINLKGEPINLSRRPWIKPIYDLPFTEQEDGTYRRKMQLVFGRQCEKSTSLGNFLISATNLIPYSRGLYVTASDVQMREFSDERLRAVVVDSPKLLELSGQPPPGMTRYVKREVQNVQTKRWINQGKITLRSAYRQGANRVRGIPADVLTIDELQDIIVDNLPVIEETTFHSEIEGGPISIYSGTPKTFDNPLEFYWQRHSTQNEWLTKCEGCNHWNCIELDNIGPVGLICIKCSKLLDPVDGKAQWVRLGKQGAEWEGFRVPQPVVIYAYRDREDIFRRQWIGLLDKKRRYGRPKMQNEVMARSYDAGTKPVSFEEVRRCCLPSKSFQRLDEMDNGLRAALKWGGVDWGTGDVSYTIASCWKYDPQGRFCLMWAKKYEGVEADPDFSIRDIIQNFRKLNVTRIGCDWGFGFHANPKLMKAFGAQKVLLYQHAGKQSEKVKWDKAGMKFITHRTRVMQDFFTLIKRGPVGQGIAFPGWEEVNEYGQSTELFMNDILSVYQEDSERRGELVFGHPVGVPDDFTHTGLYALLASQFDHPRPDLMAVG